MVYATTAPTTDLSSSPAATPATETPAAAPAKETPAAPSASSVPEQWITAVIYGQTVSWVNNYTPYAPLAATSTSSPATPITSSEPRVESTSQVLVSYPSVLTTAQPGSVPSSPVLPSYVAPASLVITSSDASSSRALTTSHAVPSSTSVISSSATSSLTTVSSYAVNSSLPATSISNSSVAIPSYATAPVYSSVASSFPPSSISALLPTLSTFSTLIASRTIGYPSSLSAASTGSIASASPTVCGESGNFTLGWDDEPSFAPSNANTSASPTYAPVFNPYHHMFFSNGYAYAPPPSDPYPPISAPRLAVFLPNASAISDSTGSPDAGGERPGELGAGPRASLNAFWFNAYSAYLGCDNSGTQPCSLQISGYAWNGTDESLVAQQTATLPACADMVNCTLTQVVFDEGFSHNLTGLQFAATVGGIMQVFYMDNLSMGWYNNTCAAGLQRQMSRR